MGLRKREYTDRETIITAESMNDIQDAILALEDGLFSIDNDKSGEAIVITDAAKRGFRSLNIFGKTTQDGTPTPDAPVDLVSIGDGGSIGVTVCGKNLISNNWQQGMLKTEDGITLISNEYWVTNADYISVDSSKDYVFSADTPNSSCVFWYDEDKHFISYIQPLRNQDLLNNRASKALVLPDYAKYARVSYNYAGTTEAITPTMMGVEHDVQLELGSTATEYEPYKGQTLTMSTPNGLPGIPVTSGGNYTDANGQQWICDEVDFFRGVYVQRVKRFVLSTSNSNIVVAWDGAGGFVISEIGIAGIDNGAMCDKLTPHTVLGIYRGEQGVNVNVSHKQLVFALDGVTTIDELKTWLQSNSLTFLYIMNVAAETPLSQEELAAYAALYTYKDHTTVSNDAGAYMELEYVMDAKKYFDSKISTGASNGIIEATVE